MNGAIESGIATERQRGHEDGRAAEARVAADDGGKDGDSNDRAHGVVWW